MATPVEPAYAPLSWRELFGSRFWLNYGVCLVASVWIPLARLQPMVEGKPLGAPTYLPMYTIYADLARHPGVGALWFYVAAHLGITFAAMALVWWLVLRRAPVRAEGDA